MSAVATVVSERYALSLYEVAKAENLAQEMCEALGQVSDLFAEYPDYLKVLTTPSIALEDKKQTIRAAFENQVHPYLLNFLLLLTENYLEAGMCAVTAITAVALTSEQMEKLKDKMASVTGKQIVLKNEVNSEVIGGVLVRIENKQIDDTVKSRLSGIAATLGQIIA